MFRFTIRDVLWLTVVVAMAVGWWASDRQLHSELQQAKAWRTRAGTLEYILNRDGWAITWDFKTNQIHTKRQAEGGAYSIGGTPSADP